MKNILKIFIVNICVFMFNEKYLYFFARELNVKIAKSYAVNFFKCQMIVIYHDYIITYSIINSDY